MRAEDALQDLLDCRILGDLQGIFRQGTVLADVLRQFTDIFRSDIIPEEGEIRMKKCPGFAAGESLLLARRMTDATFKVPPCLTVGTWSKHMVVLHELAVTYQDLPDIDDGCNLWREFTCLFRIIYPEHIPVDQPDCRSLDRVNR